jgi:hypothetical protein
MDKEHRYTQLNAEKDKKPEAGRPKTEEQGRFANRPYRYTGTIYPVIFAPK